jgi:hypothetical protein
VSDEHPQEGRRRTRLDQLLDLVFFAPIGLLAESHARVDELAQRGREQLDGQMKMARMVGQVAVRKGQKEASTRLTQLRAVPGPTSAVTTTPAPAPTVEQVIPVRGATAPQPAPAGPASSTLAIPAYDSLAASQVVPRLDGLSAAELEAVRLYESSHRGRKTILGKIAQLQAR